MKMSSTIYLNVKNNFLVAKTQTNLAADVSYFTHSEEQI